MLFRSWDGGAGATMVGGGTGPGGLGGADGGGGWIGGGGAWVASDKDDCIGGIGWAGLGKGFTRIGWSGAVSDACRPELRTDDTEAGDGAVVGGWPA